MPPRIRTIKPEFWRDQRMQLFSPLTRLLFVGLISNADDEGRLEGDLSLIRSLVFPCDNLALKKLDAMLNELAEAERIRRYTVNGMPYIEIVNWKRHQKIDRAVPSKLPAYMNGATPSDR